MDILKILSRSTKQSHKSKDGKPTKLPSAGTSANPQLYHDAIPESRGKKRKRGGEKIEEQTQGQEEDEEAVNFFATMSATVKSKKTAVVDEGKRASNSNDAQEAAPELLEEGECRQILRSHRLKVTLLARDVVVKKKTKKSKKSKSSKEVPSTKVENKQLYPQPLTTFAELRTTYGISGRMAENLSDQGYKIPTEVQMGSLPLLLQPATALGKSSSESGSSDEGSNIDLLSIAPTGSGKTLAFLIPVVNGIMQRRRQIEDKGEHDLEAIIIAPTKELATQIVNEAKKLSIGTGVKVVGMRKGMRIVGGQDAVEDESSSGSEEEESGDEKQKPRKSSAQPISRADVLVTTPGLLLGAISTSSPDTHIPLPTVRTLVLDEADVLLDPLFRDQTLGIWNSCTNPSLRATLWSATMGSNIETLASSTINERRSKLNIEQDSSTIRLVVGLKDSAIPNITHKLIYAATEPGKLLALRQLLHPTARSTDATASLRPPFLVFTQTIPRAIALHSELMYDIPAEAGGSTRIAVLHSDLSDTVRAQIMSRFRNGEVWILITTDILSRGVDFRGINGVVNYDVPNSGAAYIHRVGRTGRAGRDGGVAVTFYTKEDIPYVRDIANIIAASEKAAGKAPGEASMQKWLLDALPKPSKEEKKKLKMYGVETRRGGLGKGKEGKEAKGAKGRMQISTKSGYERRLEHNRKGAIQGSRRRAKEAEKLGGEEQSAGAGEDSEWGGIDE